MFKKEILVVLARYTPKLGAKWVTLQKFLEDKLAELETDPDVIEFSEYDQYGRAQDKLSNVWAITSSEEFLEEIRDKDSAFYRYIKLSKSVANISNKVFQINFWKMFFDKKKMTHSKKDVRNLYKECEKRYPLLKYLRCDYGSDFKDVKADLPGYINNKDLEHSLSK